MDVLTGFDLNRLLRSLQTKIQEELSTNPSVFDVGSTLDLGAVPIDVRKWHRVDDVVAVVADLRRSTQLSSGKHAASTAAIYEAAIATLASTLDAFGADFNQIQGDGSVAIFWGERAYERAFCAAVTIRTYSEDPLVSTIKAKWPDVDTGFRLGMASGRAVVKRVRNLNGKDPFEYVWTGQPVNYAAKAAHADVNAHRLVVTGGVWDHLKVNDYVTISCGCGTGNGPKQLWSDINIETLMKGNEDEARGRMLTSPWCATHGQEYCAAILRGDTQREEATAQREIALRSQMQDSLRKIAEQKREDRRNRNRKLTGRY